ncbi:MAG: hypothetical protein J5787_00195 [Alphaproteobacteria bacterium]|nr:hypothetical protein [Alphaproteobacteria bacterium]MBO4643928.1 hypothetical protein [Alphaproteobacteria bacterium]
MKDFLKLIFFGVTKSPKLRLFNPDTDEKIEMTTGFNWQILLLGSFFGLPLFSKRLWAWAWGLFFLSTVQAFFFYQQVKQILAATTVAEYEAAMRQADNPIDSAIGYLLMFCVVLLSVKGNQWAVERLLKKGWRFEDVSDPLVRDAVGKWKISKRYLTSPEVIDKL